MSNYQSRSGLSRANYVETLEQRLCLSAAAVARKSTAGSAAIAAAAIASPRQIENLGRGVVAVRASTTQILVSWRLLALDPAAISFNVYRAAGTAAPVKLNASPITASTNYADTTANFTVNNTYTVRPVLGGVEQAASAGFTLTANHAVEPVVRVPLRAPGEGYTTKYVWAGDLDGNGEYDFVIDRLSSTGGTQRIEAYKQDGTFLWDIDLGPSSTNTYNIEPGAATIDVGNWDGVAVQDMDGDGKAEVMIKTADGVRLGDGRTVVESNPNIQYISVLNGLTGGERARVQWTTDYLSDGPTAMMFATGTVDGVHPSLYIKGKNRVGSGGFNQTVAAFRFDGTTLTRQWQFKRGNQDLPDGHNIRIVDLDGDGKDEFTDIGFALNSDGTLRYSLAATGGIVHGDRYYIGDIDPARPGLEGYGIQQDNPSKLYDYLYDASTGQMIWQHFSADVVDVGRGLTADIDPRFPGMETFAFNGIWNAQTNTQVSTTGPWPSHTLQFDGDLTSELYNDGKIEEWVPNGTTGGLGRLETLWKVDATATNVFPPLIGDLFGDWREEVVMMSGAHDALTIMTTNRSTAYRFYTFAQNPEYRNGMSQKGYHQSPELDYFFGQGMTTPPTPNVVYAGTQPATTVVTGVYQAEAATRSATVSIDSNYSGYHGTGFANFPPAAGTLAWNDIPGGLGGTTTIRFRYALGATTARVATLTVNGVAQPVTFDPTGGYTQWATVAASVTLTPGATNVIRLESTGQDAGNIDELQVDATLPAGPAVSSFVVNGGAAQRSRVTSLALTFDRPVTLASSAVTLWRRISAATVATQVGGFTLTSAADLMTYTLTFASGAFPGRSLDDGLYEVRVAGAGVTYNALAMAADAAFSFYRLGGDIDANRRVDFNDFLGLQTAFGSTTGSPGFAPGLDFDDDGAIDFDDFLVLQTQYGRTM